MSPRAMSLPTAALIGSERDPLPLWHLTRDMKRMQDEAWTEFHRRYFSRMFAYAATLHSGDQASAEDTVQSAFLRAVRNIRRFEDEEVFWSWLTLLLRCAAADQGRKSSARQRLFESLQEEIDAKTVAPWEEGGSRLVLLEEAMNELSDEERTLLQQKYLDGDPTETIAKRLSTTAKAVECRLRRLRRKLQSRIHVLRKQIQL